MEDRLKFRACLRDKWNMVENNEMEDVERCGKYLRQAS